MVRWKTSVNERVTTVLAFLHSFWIARCPMQIIFMKIALEDRAIFSQAYPVSLDGVIVPIYKMILQILFSLEDFVTVLHKASDQQLVQATPLNLHTMHFQFWNLTSFLF